MLGRKLRKGQTMIAKVFSKKADGKWLEDGKRPMRQYHGVYYYDTTGDCQRRMNRELTKILGYAAIVQQAYYEPLTDDLYLVIVRTKKNCDYYKALEELGFVEYQYNEAFA